MSSQHTLSVLRIEMVGTVTSFRYPHFVQGFQPTFEMPPPSTIYGHICGAVGDYIPPDSVRFGYHFTHEAKFIDYQEHLHFDDPVQPFPFNRELLYNPKLTLYLDNLDLRDAFLSPCYPVILGRSQDLMTYTSVQVVELVRAEAAYFEHTLLPLEISPHLREATIAVTMPRYIDPRRRTTWQQYALLQKRALWPQKNPSSGWDDDEEDSLSFEESPQIEFWVDPDSLADTRRPDSKRAVWFHRFVD